MAKHLPNFLLAFLVLMSVALCAYVTLYQGRVQIYTEEPSAAEEGVETEGGTDEATFEDAEPESYDS